MNTPTGNQIIDFVLFGPAGRGADPMDPDKRRATADEVEKFIYGGKPIDWAHLADIASAARHQTQFSDFPWIRHPLGDESADDRYDGPGTPGMSELPGD